MKFNTDYHEAQLVANKIVDILELQCSIIMARRLYNIHNYKFAKTRQNYLCMGIYISTYNRREKSGLELPLT